MISKLFRVTTEELELYRFCPVLHSINKTDKEFIRFVDHDPYKEAILESIDLLYKNIFINNTEPKEKAFIATVMAWFEKNCGMSEDEHFMSGVAINQMREVASNAYKILEPTFENILLHPIRFDIHAGFGDMIVDGRAYPIVKLDKKPTVMIIDTLPTITHQHQYIDLNMSAFRVWVFDNFQDVRTIGYFNINSPHKGIVNIPLYFGDLRSAHKHITDLTMAVKNNIIFPTNPENCSNCSGNCVDILTRSII